MGSATIRRFALVAAMVLLAPIWCRPAAVVTPLKSAGAPLIGLAPTGGSSTPDIPRSGVAGWWTASRTDYARGPVAVGVVALLALLTLAGWAPLVAMRSSPSPLIRRRHVIALRAPPPLLLTWQSQ